MATSPTADRRFRPPHCPNPNCKYHNEVPDNWPYVRRGHYCRHTPPRRIPRFTCRHCGRNFSSQSFSCTYWLKRPDLLPQVFQLTVGCMANRQIARTIACAPATVDSLIARLGRHCLLWQRLLIRNIKPRNNIAVDGLSCFEHSQYFPFEHPLSVDNPTSFILHFTDAPLRRSGSMTPYQKRKRKRLEAALGRPDPRAVEKAMTEVLEVSLDGAQQATVCSDEHQAYPRAIRRLRCKVNHVRISSRQRRDRHNILFEINCLDMFVRHSSSNHKRETIAFSKRRQASAERLAVFTVWRNFIKTRYEKKCRQTPAMLIGLVERVLEVKDILARRLFPGLIPLPPRWREYYWRRVLTPVLGRNRRHELKYAF